MRIVNDGLPPPVYDWILASNASYYKGEADISVTELIGPPRIRVLKNKNEDKITINASTLLNVSLGSSVHKQIQDATKVGFSERRLSIDVKDWKVSGGMDHYNDGVLSDWKTCNKWKTVMADQGRIEEFEQQLNCYAHILRCHDIPVNKLKIFALFKDWNVSEYKSYLKRGDIFESGMKQGYPEKEWLYFDIRLWSELESKAYMEERVKLHQEAEKSLPQCTKEETWSGRRCEKYCLASPYCDQYNRKE